MSRYSSTEATEQKFYQMQSVLKAFGINDGAIAEPFGTGLINHTWKITASGKEYILQKLNHSVFAKPENISYNIELIADYLSKTNPGYRFIAPLPSLDGNALVHIEQGFFRIFPFIGDSHSKEIAATPGTAFEAASQFGRFTRMLSGFEVNKLKITISHFHDLSLRFKQFTKAVKDGNAQRIATSQELIKTLMTYREIVEEYEKIKTNPGFKLRVTHHDTKISNVLFNADDEGICVIDLDTVMPGYFISDVGDMMRTYLSPVSEEEKDLDQIEVREDYYKAIVQGYYAEMKGELSMAEKGAFFYAGKFMIYMQALRFLTDHLNDDAYYGAAYESHNLVRANNQAVLLQRLLEKEKILTVFPGG